MDQALQEKLESLLAPIAEDHPGGEDLTYSPLYEQIREARRADDPSLPQEEWEAPVKAAEWGRVCTLCEAGLRTRSKDLQLAAWYTEALVRQDGYSGAAFGFRLITGLLQRFWEVLYPAFDQTDMEERSSKIEWLNTQLGQTLRQVPITAPQQGGYDWFRWQESRDVENLGRGGDPKAKDKALAEGKLSGEVFDKCARDSGVVWFQTLSSDLAQARAAFDELVAEMDNRFGEHTPVLAGVREALDVCGEVVRRLHGQYGGGPTEMEAPPDGDVGAVSPEGQGSETPRGGNPAMARADAIRKLREVAYYFRTHEPHSPVALLVERAAKWAEMRLEDWLRTVIKDAPTLEQLRELLDIKQD